MDNLPRPDQRSTKCKGRTKKNEPCRKWSSFGTGYCQHHQDQASEQSTDTEKEFQQHRTIVNHVENEKLMQKINNQKQTIHELELSNQRLKTSTKFLHEENNELRRQGLITQLKHEEQINELSNIINDLTLEIKQYKRELIVSEINAESYHQLLKCEQYFDTLKKIRNKICPYLTDRRFHIEQFVKNPKCLETARTMYNLDKHELVQTYFEYKAIRNRLAHPVFKNDLSDSLINII